MISVLEVTQHDIASAIRILILLIFFSTPMAPSSRSTRPRRRDFFPQSTRIDILPGVNSSNGTTPLTAFVVVGNARVDERTCELDCWVDRPGNLYICVLPARPHVLATSHSDHPARPRCKSPTTTPVRTSTDRDFGTLRRSGRRRRGRLHASLRRPHTRRLRMGNSAPLIERLPDESA